MYRTTLRRAGFSNAPSAPPEPAWSTTCLNCGSDLTDAFCSHCGQRALPPHPTVTELAGDAFAELSGWDGKLSETLKLLVRRPGELTREFIAGRRARFISPVRLYLTMSFIYFVVAAAAPQPRETARPGDVSVAGIHIIAGQPTRGPQSVAAAAVAARDGELTQAERDAALADVKTAPSVFQRMLRRAVEDPVGLKQDVNKNLPRVLFLLVPVFAAILALFYRGRHYPEHLYFSIHLHAFAFLALIFAALARYAHSDRLAVVAGLSVAGWIGVYAVTSLRRVYGGSLLTTLAKAAGIGAVYVVLASAAMLGLVFYAGAGASIV